MGLIVGRILASAIWWGAEEAYIWESSYLVGLFLQFYGIITLKTCYRKLTGNSGV